MKKIVFFIIGVLFLTLAMASAKPGSSIDIDSSDCILCRIIPDSIFSVVKGNPVILYTYGHYGYSWALITRMNGEFKAFSGKVSPAGNIFITTSTEDNKIDSTLLFENNRHLLDWGLDTMARYAKCMTGIKAKQYINIYTDLTITDSDGASVFSSDNAVSFSGPDSIAFNEKFNRLGLLMYWIADSCLRSYLPEFNR